MAKYKSNLKRLEEAAAKSPGDWQNLLDEYRRQMELHPDVPENILLKQARDVVNARAEASAAAAKQGRTRTIGTIAEEEREKDRPSKQAKTKGGRKRSEPPEDEAVPNMPASMFAGKDCTEPEALSWAAANMSLQITDWYELARKCPSAAAWSLLAWAKASPSNHSRLFDMWTKLIPPTRELEKLRRITSDGRKLMGLIAAWEFDEMDDRKRRLRIEQIKGTAAVKYDPFAATSEDPEDGRGD